MKDYTISHPCGLEEICPSLREAKRSALQHHKDCQLAEADTAEVFIDEYDHELGEMSGRYWKV